MGKYLKAGLGKCNLLVEADVVGCRPNKRNTNELLLRLTEKVNEKNFDSNDAYGVIANILQKITNILIFRILRIKLLI